MMPHELELFIQDVAARVALRLGWDKNDVYGPYMEPMQRVSQPGPLTKYQCMKANLVWSFSPERVSELRNKRLAAKYWTTWWQMKRDRAIAEHQMACDWIEDLNKIYEATSGAVSLASGDGGLALAEDHAPDQ
jgi:hypothetical protein